MSWRETLRSTTDRLRREVHAVALACRDPRTPWYAKVTAAIVVAFAVSPIDLVPDFIPVIGYLDDAILIPLGIALVVRMVPREVMADCRARAATAPAGRGGWIAATAIVVFWAVGLLLAWRWFRRRHFAKIGL
jgi:uncharacterized membrane protein YkvA (DUF1232 family)